MSEWTTEQTDDIQEVDEKKKPGSKTAFDQTEQQKRRKPAPGDEKGSRGEKEEEPDKDREAAP